MNKDNIQIQTEEGAQLDDIRARKQSASEMKPANIFLASVPLSKCAPCARPRSIHIHHGRVRSRKAVNHSQAPNNISPFR
jgi:hypothetical protein